MRLGDLELDRARALVREKGLGGQRKSRAIHMKPVTVRAVRDWLAVRDIDGKSVFGLSGNGIYQMMRRVAQRAGVTDRHNPHSFRHGFARGALDKGLDLASLSQLLGHSDVSITARFYARWADEELHTKHAKVSWMPDDVDE
jgi:integrase